jgi:hypothetical protein
VIISYTIFKAYIHSMFRTSQLWRNNCANAPSIRKYGCYITVAVIFLWNDDATTTRTRHTVLRRYDYCLLQVRVWDNIPFQWHFTFDSSGSWKYSCWLLQWYTVWGRDYQERREYYCCTRSTRNPRMRDISNSFLIMLIYWSWK